MKARLILNYEQLIAPENLFDAWREFARGKRDRRDVQAFSLHLADNILQLHDELANFSYQHGPYEAFNISDPKPRSIHKASVRDRVLHHAIYRRLYPFFDKTFIPESYSCRNGKGVHKALDCFRRFSRQVSRNHSATTWVLKCDIRKFFASIDHGVLRGILALYIPDSRIRWLLGMVINGFSFDDSSRGLPLGNLTSQLFCNVYMNQFDQFVKHQLRAPYYLRYGDDFVLFSRNKEWLQVQLQKISAFLSGEMHLTLHPDKVFIKTLASGVDFLGWCHFSRHRVLRTTTKRRMLRRIAEHPTNETFQSYLGLLSHGNASRLKEAASNLYGLLHIG